MRIIDGLNYYDKLESMVLECIEKAQEFPYEDFIFIAENKEMLEQLFLKHTHYLVNIQIMTWSSFLHFLQVEHHLTKHKSLSNIDFTYYLYNILKEHSFECIHTDQYYPLINKLIPLMKEYNLSLTKYNTVNSKLKDLMSIYTLLEEQLDDYTHLTFDDIFKQADISCDAHIYIEGDHLYQPLRQRIIQKLNDVTVLYTYANDNRIFNIPYHQLCINSEHFSNDTFLTQNLFHQSVEKYQRDKELYTFLAPTPVHEVKRVVYTMKQMIVDKGLRYQDFAIVYPDHTYIDILLRTLSDIPHNLPIIQSGLYDYSYKKILELIPTLHQAPLSQIAQQLKIETLEPEYKTYLDALSSFDSVMNESDFENFFKETCLIKHQEINNIQDQVIVCSIDELKLVSPRHIFILGMNETILPHFIKDASLLLNEDIKALRQQGITTPFNTLEQLALHHNDILKALQQPYLSMTFSYSTSTLSGETLLKSSLYKQLSTMYTLKELPTNTYLPIDDYYLNGGFTNEKEIINHHIKDYIESKNQPSSIHPDIIKQLYSSTMSVSQIETYNKCPFLYFVQYGLGIYPMKDKKLMPNELGSLVHYVLAENIDRSKNIKELVEGYISKDENLYTKILSSNVNQYFIEQLIKDLDITLDVLNQFLNISEFHIHSQEEKVQDIIQGIDFKGFVDRIDIYSHYVSIIDYKSSAKDINLNLAMQGFNIQMLLYLKMVTQKYNKDPGAVLYFNTKKRILSIDQHINKDIAYEDIFSLYKYGGYVIDDDCEVIHALDPTFDKKSNIIKISYVQSRDEYKGQILTTPKLKKLFEIIENHIYELYVHMTSGKIKIAPKGSDDPSTHTLVNPCHYCPYSNVCHFDIFYNEYEFVDFYDVEEKLGGEEDAI